ncbi:sodium:proton exchanger [Candidatus Pacearchaeota archaeon]|nr:sodium:proton exchanger [Candidatus Pacearchaeota archaeon]|tara:strand:+ start:404 stop:2077 length:1674 start_codon:yes stop_codon:yes gene_type:complete
MEIFVELSIIIAITVVISGIMRLLRQPLVIGYILTGIIVSPYFLNLVQSTETITVFSQIGVTLLLFIVGLSLSPKVIKEVGKVSLITGLGQIIFTSIIGFFISKALGFTTTTSIYIAIALTFSSTIIIMKLLSDKRDLDKLYGKISIGFLLVQDIVAIILLMVVSSFSGRFSIESISQATILNGIFLIGGFIVVSIFALPRLSKFFAKSQEFLFLFSIGWGLGIATIFHYVGFSMEIGALLAGISLSVSPYNFEISSKMRPLRDFFIILFFVLLGSQLVFGSINQLIIPAIIFSAFILIGNPLIVMVLMGIMGYKRKMGFQAGLTVAQISEFSLILIALGVAVGHLSKDILSLVTIVGLITISGSTYLITYSDKIFPYISRYLSIFERKNSIAFEQKVEPYEAILFGYNRAGFHILNSFKKLKKKFLVVDYNPDTIAKLTKQKINNLYGDSADKEFIDSVDLSKVKLVISTIPDIESNVIIRDRLKELGSKAVFVATAEQVEDANFLYKTGADYVMIPHLLGGEYVSHLIEHNKTDSKKYKAKARDHMRKLRKRSRK